MNAELPTLYVCHGDDKSPRMHPCGRVQAVMRAKGIAYDKVIAGRGSPFPFMRKGSREELQQAHGGCAPLNAGEQRVRWIAQQLRH